MYENPKLALVQAQEKAKTLGATRCEDPMWNGCLTKLESLLNASMVTTLFTRSSATKQGRTVGSRNMNLELTNMESTVSLLGTFRGLKPVRRHDEIAKKMRASWLKS